jgi:hypothetical protein
MKTDTRKQKRAAGRESPAPRQAGLARRSGRDALSGQEPLAIGDLILTEVLRGFDDERDFNDAREMLTALTVVECASSA